jgi:hypothetical protein
MRILAHLALLPLAAFALLQIARTGTPVAIFAWLAASVVLHDLVLLPFYSALDAAGRRAAGSAVNFIRVPAGISLLLLLVFFPVISARATAPSTASAVSTTRATSRAGC